MYRLIWNKTFFSTRDSFQIFANRFESIFLYLLNFKSLPIFSSRFFSIFSLSNLSIVSLAQKYKFSNCKKFNSNWFDYDFFIPSHFQIFVNYFNRFRSGNFPIKKFISSRFDYDSSIPSHFQIFSSRFLSIFSVSNLCQSFWVDSTIIPSYLLTFKSLLDNFTRFRSGNFPLVKSLIRIKRS